MAPSSPPRVQVIRPGQTYVGRQGFTYGAGASAETVGAQHICMNVLPMPPGARAKVHYHDRIETIAYLLDGECVVYYGDDVQHRALVRAGDQIFVPADVPHAPWLIDQASAMIVTGRQLKLHFPDKRADSVGQGTVSGAVRYCQLFGGANRYHWVKEKSP